MSLVEVYVAPAIRLNFDTAGILRKREGLLEILAGWLAGWLAAWLPAAWLPGCLAAWLPGCLAAWRQLAAWLPGCQLPGCLAPQ